MYFNASYNNLSGPIPGASCLSPVREMMLALLVILQWHTLVCVQSPVVIQQFLCGLEGM